MLVSVFFKKFNTMVSLKEKIGYGFGDMASSTFWKIFSAYLMIFYTDIFGLGAAAVGTMFLVTRIWDSVFDPIVGVVSDRTSSRWGKFRPYILYLAIPYAIMGVLTFYTPNFGHTGKLIYAYITYSLMMMIYSSINVPYASLLGVMSPDPKDRNTLSTYRMMFAFIGSFLALLLFEPLANLFTGNISNLSPELITQAKQHGWMMSMVVMGVICAVLFYFCFSFTKENVKPIKNKQNSLKTDLKNLAHNSPWWILLGAGIFTLVFNSVRDGAAVFYFKYFINEDSFETVTLFSMSFMMSGIYLALGQFANIIGVLGAAPLSNKIGKKKTFALAMGIAAGLSIIFYWFGREQIVMIFIFQILISICTGSIFPLLWSMYADCADYSEYKTGNRATGLIFSASSMTQKFGWAIGTSVTGWLLAYFGFEANQIQSEYTIHGIRMFLSWIPALGAVLSMIFIIFYPLSEKKMKNITSQLKIQREQLAEDEIDNPEII